MFVQQVTFLYARDLEQSAAFYGDTLGLELVLDQGSCRIFRASRDGFLGVCQCTDDRASKADGVIVTFVTDDVDGWYERLKARGVAFDTTPGENAKFNIYHCFLSDPDGYKVEIQMFQDPAWPKPE